jgi:hypothetical protein
MTNRRNVPAPALNKLLELSDAAEFLSDKLIAHEEALAAARRRWNDANFVEQKEYEDTRAAVEQLVADLPTLKKRCDAAQATYGNCRAWLDALPPDVALEAVTVKLDGTLKDVRARIADLEQEQHAIASAPPPPRDLERAVKEYVRAAATAPTTILYNNEVSPRWGTHTAYGPDPSRAPRDIWGTLAWLLPDVLGQALMRTLEEQATAAQKVPLAKREERIVAIEEELAELAYAEEGLISTALAAGQQVERRSDAPAPAILGIRVVARERSAA